MKTTRGQWVRGAVPYQSIGAALSVSTWAGAGLLFTLALFLWAGKPESIQERVEAPKLSRLEGRLQLRIDSAKDLSDGAIASEPLQDPAALFRFYALRDYRPAWSGEAGPLPEAERLLQTIREGERDGLRPDDYHLSALERTRAAIQWDRARGIFNLDREIDLDLLLTDAFFGYGHDLRSGRLRMEAKEMERPYGSDQIDLVLILQEALQSNSVREALLALRPPHPGYFRLMEGLSRYRNLAREEGGAPLPGGPPVKKGDRGEPVRILRRRLLVTGDLLPSGEEDRFLFDEALESAVSAFQRRHGLAPDGVVGPATRAALNVPISQRVRQIELNLERLRWLPRDLGRRHIIINAADFTLEVVEGERQVMSMRVIAGRKYRQTPSFTAEMTHIVLSPYWQVPPRLAIEDLLPLVQKDVRYLERQKIKVFLGWNHGGKEIPPGRINWSKVSRRNFVYRFRQEPGPANPLGRVKFVFPNPFDIYLHDTPARELFGRTVRDFSSGCIRIEKPIELAEYLLRDDPEWSREALLNTIGRQEERWIRLPAPLPVHLVYWTAWADEAGAVHFRDDLYGRDLRMDRALHDRKGISVSRLNSGEFY